MQDGIRHQFPQATTDEIQGILRERLDKIRQNIAAQEIIVHMTNIDDIVLAVIDAPQRACRFRT